MIAQNSIDLDDISYDQALIDLGIANRRIVELCIEISSSSDELERLRKKAVDRRSANIDHSRHGSVGNVRTDGEKKALRKHKFKALRLFRSAAPNILWSLDEVCGSGSFAAGEARHRITRQNHFALEFRGWAVPAERDVPFKSILIKIANESFESQQIVDPDMRSDVGRHYGDTNLSRSGFRVKFPMLDTPAGCYDITLVGIKADGDRVKTGIGKIELV